ncbi:MAG: PHP domain-containing protein [Bacteroidales bacterium]|nr:PHP domain-containing protein [Bacteroidales bacterium]
MNIHRADFHIHTLLSPCGDLSMSPANIISAASRKGLEIIGITDHNSTRQSELVKKLGKEKGIFVLQGAEVTTREEVHCLAFFEDPDSVKAFQQYIDMHLPDLQNDPVIFGDQVVVDENEDIIYIEEKLLVNATTVTIGELEKYVRENGGIFIPAHIDRMKNSIYSQLGFIPGDLKADALEVSRRSTPENFASIKPEIRRFSIVTNSDAHFPEHIGMVWNNIQIEEISFKEIKMALSGINDRKIVS